MMNIAIWLLVTLLGLGAFFAQSSNNEPVSATATPTSGRMSRAEMVKTVQQNPDSELEARVLEDGVVTAEEYEKAVNAYLTCMSSAGYELQTEAALFLPGVYQYIFDSGNDPSTPVPENEFTDLVTISDDCSVGTTMNIEAIYGDQIANPGDVERMTLTVVCLETTGIIDEGELTATELETALAQENPDLPFDIWDEQAMSCLVNPSQNGLGTPPTQATPLAESTPAPQ